MVKIIETPRDGFQGLPNIIATREKIEYINLLLRCGFHTVEVGSFVSPKLIPQMADTANVIDGLDLSNTNSKIAVLVATERGAKQAVEFEQVDQIFFPFSTSPTFLKRNINQSIEDAVITIYNIQNQCVTHGKQLVVFFSIGFGNAYNDTNWSIELLYKYIEIFITMGITTFPFSDIFGEVSPNTISEVFSRIIPEFPVAEFGLHLHSESNQRIDKVAAAYEAGVKRFDTVINGLGGCPQTGKELVGNLPLEDLLLYCNESEIESGLNTDFIKMARDYKFNS